MNWWSLRIDALEGITDLTEVNKEILDYFLKGISENCSQYLVCQESHPKVHYHAVICTRDSESTIRKNCFSEKLKVKRMSKYCHQIKDDEELNKAIRYTCKGTDFPYEKDTNPIVKLQSKIKFTDEYIKFMHDEYWRIFHDCQAKGFKEDRKERSLNFLEEVAYELLKQRDKWNAQEFMHRKAVRLALLRSYRNKGKGFDTGVIKKHMYGVLNILDPAGVAEIMEEYFEAANL